MLEAAQHGDNCFATLTYDDEHLPEGGSLEPKHTQDWLKRLRKSVEPLKIRYYLVGEYGDETQRPHYHVALFNLPSCLHGQTLAYRPTCCARCATVQSSWPYGKVYLGTLEADSAQYISGYVTKKMTRKDDDRLGGRYPEFCRMSLRPGIGADAMHEVASVLMEYQLDTSQADVPAALRHGPRQLPLGRYLRRKLRTMVGKDEKAPDEVIEQYQEELRPLHEAAKAVTSAPGMTLARKYVFRDMLCAEDDQKVLNMETRQRIFKQRKSL